MAAKIGSETPAAGIDETPATATAEAPGTSLGATVAVTPMVRKLVDGSWKLVPDTGEKTFDVSDYDGDLIDVMGMEKASALHPDMQIGILRGTSAGYGPSFAEGFAPIRPEDIPDYARRGFAVNNHPELGACLTYGDAFAAWRPKEVANQVNESREARYKAEYDERMKAADKGSRELGNINDDYIGLNATGTSLMENPLDMGIPLEQIMEEQEALNNAAIEGNKNVTMFGGFGGSPKYNQTDWARR